VAVQRAAGILPAEGTPVQIVIQSGGWRSFLPAGCRQHAL